MSVSAYDHDYISPPHPSTQANASVVQRPVQPQRAVQTSVKGTTFMRSPVVHTRPVAGQNFSYASAATTQTYVPGSVPELSSTLETGSYENSASSLNLVVPIREPSPEPVVEEPPAPAVQDPSTSEVAEEEDDGDDGEIDIQIRNVVCNYTLPLHIDLRKLALNSNNVTFDRGRGVLLKQKRKPNCYVKIYSSGKVYIVGCKSEADCMIAARTIARRVQKTMNKENDVVRIRNYKLAQQYPAQSQYEPELSVGLVWRSQDPKATLRIHTTGSITVTGASSESDVMRSIEMMYPIVRKFRCAMRHRTEPKRKRPPRKRAAPSSMGGPSAKRPTASPSGSGLVGNRVYFSDEDDIYDEDDLLDDED
ncbi:transcription factor TFIID [Ostertagia ostertagi]